MTSHRQAVELLAPYVGPGDQLLDVGCGSGYFFHSLRNRAVPVEYYGMDAAPSLLEIGRRIMPRYGLDSAQLLHLRLEDLRAQVDHVVCINVLSHIDNYHRPLERMLQAAAKTVILRESVADISRYQYVRDSFLDEGTDLRVHVNTYGRGELENFISSYGFRVDFFTDEFTGGKPQDVIGYPHHWTFLRCVRQKCRTSPAGN
jgi:ubiquinone/menaquinone biosynthesis C-methylase UbiE